MLVAAYNFYPIYFTVLFVLYGLMMAALLGGCFFVMMVVATEAKRWKRFSHIGWISGTAVSIMSIVNAAVFSMTILLITDSCGVTHKIHEA